MSCDAGTAVRDYVHVWDLVRAHIEVLGLERPPKGVHVFNVATGTPTTVLEFVNACRSVTNTFIRIKFGARKSNNPDTLYASSDALQRVRGDGERLHSCDPRPFPCHIHPSRFLGITCLARFSTLLAAGRWLEA